MNIDLNKITVRNLSNGYEDKQESGVIGYDGKLDIRPPYQREFIYKDKQRNAVIDSITKDFPLKEMEADHITPWHEGGKTNEENCQLLCKEDNRRKSGK